MDHYEFCPTCQAICKTSLTVSIKKATDPRGVEIDVLALHLHCDACLTYLHKIEEDVIDFVETTNFPAYLP